jgi:hypothetical protein
MARTAETPVVLARGGGVAVTAVTINPTLVTNGVTLANANSDKLIVRVTNSDTNPHNLIIRAGTNLTPAWMAGQGDLTVAVAASATEYVALPDSARYLQDDGSLSIDFSSGFTGTLELVKLP